MKITKVIDIDFDMSVFDKSNTNIYKETVINYSDLSHVVTSDLGVEIPLAPCLNSNYAETGFNRFNPLTIYDTGEEQCSLPYSFIGLVTVIKSTPSENSFKELLREDVNYIKYLNENSVKAFEQFKEKSTEHHWSNLESTLRDKSSRTSTTYLLEDSYDVKRGAFTKANSHSIVKNNSLPDNHIRIYIANKIRKDIFIGIDKRTSHLSSYTGVDGDRHAHLLIEIYKDGKIVNTINEKYSVEDILEHKVPIYFSLEECQKNIETNTFEQALLARKVKEIDESFKNSIHKLEDELYETKQTLKNLSLDISFNEKITKLEQAIASKETELFNHHEYTLLLSELEKEVITKRNINNARKLINTVIKVSTTTKKTKPKNEPKPKPKPTEGIPNE